MAKLLQEIEWEPPLLVFRANADYETELIKRLSPWLRAAVESMSDPVKFSYATSTLIGVSQLVTSQENACRYCYGLERAAMKIWGYSEKQIQDLEEEASLTDGITRHVVRFARKLAKSNPSPARKDCDDLLAEGLSQEAVFEIAACVGEACFANRVATFLALPPQVALDKLPTSFLGRIFGPLYRKKMVPKKSPPPEDFQNDGPCAAIIAAAGNTQLALWLRRITDGCMDDPVIPRRCKVLMLAVIARQIGSRLCEKETWDILAGEGLSKPEFDMILSALSSPVLTSVEERLLRWTRETVWYEPRIIQNSTRKLFTEVGEKITLEAIGTAALCNTLARLSLVRQ
jgi:alkylhydroperoxidase family enzyme